MKNIFEKILFGVKVANDNIIVLNEKIDAIAKLLSYEEGESIDAQANKKTTAFWKLAKLDYLCASDGVNHMYKDLKESLGYVTRLFFFAVLVILLSKK